MNSNVCAAYARLARRLMEMYRKTPDAEIFRMCAGISGGNQDVIDLHNAMAKHHAECDVCSKNQHADRKVFYGKRRSRPRSATC